MKRYAQTLNLKDDPAIIARYVEHHRAVWPEVERGLRAIGIEKMLICRLGRRLFMVMETSDAFEPERDWPRYMESDPRVGEWQSLMESFQEPALEAQPGEWWAAMEQVYGLGDDARG
jgi:L-rhamnose mutarotase